MGIDGGQLLYKIYRALTYGLSPLIDLHLRWRKLRGLEHRRRWRERLGVPSLRRPPGPLFWFHAVSLGEGMAAISVIKRCVERRPDATVLMTTTTLSAFEVIKDLLPDRVLYQFVPVDTPNIMDAFLKYWNPDAIVLMESELWPNLIMSASRNGIALAILNARMSLKSFRMWSSPVVLQMTKLMLSKFSLIVPLAIHFQLLQASPSVINFSGDLKFAIEDFDDPRLNMRKFQYLRVQLAQRPVWVASSIHRGEEMVMLGVHKMLKQIYSDIITIIVPRHPQHGREIAIELQKEGMTVALRSRQDNIIPQTDIYMVDTLGELRCIYRLTPIAVVGGSFLPGLSGHNISEAAAAGCAVLTGHHIGHFLHMAHEMQRINPLSVVQVSGTVELCGVLSMLFSNAKALEEHRVAARQAFSALSNGISVDVFNLLQYHVFRKPPGEMKATELQKI